MWCGGVPTNLCVLVQLELMILVLHIVHDMHYRIIGWIIVRTQIS